jgi:hypothetical protein
MAFRTSHNGVYTLRSLYGNAPRAAFRSQRLRGGADSRRVRCVQLTSGSEAMSLNIGRAYDHPIRHRCLAGRRELEVTVPVSALTG